jgi:hypothetical protein
MRRLVVVIGVSVCLATLTIVRLPTAPNAGQPSNQRPHDSPRQPAAAPAGAERAPAATLVTPRDGSVTPDQVVSFTASVSADRGLSSATLLLGEGPRTVVFSGPIQTQDAQITADTPQATQWDGPRLVVDGAEPHAHSLLKFPSLIGSGDDQVPPGADITEAVLQLYCPNAGDMVRMYRLTEEWTDREATWTERLAGIPWRVAGGRASESDVRDALLVDCTTGGFRSVDVTTLVREWASGASNHGLILTDSGADGVTFGSGESAGPPALSVTYLPQQRPVQSRRVTGRSAVVTFSTMLSAGRAYRWNVLVTDASGAARRADADFAVTFDPPPPDDPILVAPPDGARVPEASPALEFSVGDPGGGMLDVAIAVRKAAAPEFTIIALPDTQSYSEGYPEIFTAQTRWIVDNAAARNIVFVTHVGDVVDHEDDHAEWLAANRSMSLLDGRVPYGIAPGNHDRPTVLFNSYFPYTRYQGRAWYGGHFRDSNDSSYQLFSGGGIDFVIVHLEFCPPPEAVAWADGVLKAHPARVGIVTTHGYLGLLGERSVLSCRNTQYLWDGLAVPNPNLRFLLCGHAHGEIRRADTVDGRSVFQLLADYQDRPNGGDGWLRILRFVPGDDKVYVQTFSPTLNRFETDADSQFALDFGMGGAFETLTTVSARSGSTISTRRLDLSSHAEYEWQVTIVNGHGKRRVGPVWRVARQSPATPSPGAR